MKITLLCAAILLLQSVCKSQDLVFRMNQSGISHKNDHNGLFDDAELKASEVFISLQDKQVVVDDRPMAKYTLDKMLSKNNNIKHLFTQTWKGTDQNKTPIQFKYTVNVQSKEAMVEVKYPEFKTYYFGTYNYGSTGNEGEAQGTAKTF